MITKPKKVKKILTQDRLYAVALWYLERFGGTRARLQRTLQRRIAKARSQFGADLAPEAEMWIEDILQRLAAAGHLNDVAFADSRIAKGRRQGKSRQQLRYELTQAGVAMPLQAQALAAAEEADPDVELRAAQAYLRRRKLGPYRQGKPDGSALEPDLKRYEKDLARLARRGFSCEVAQRALASSPF